jgi:hypothetical protein
MPDGWANAELLHNQIQGFAKLLHVIETMSAGQLKGA